MSMAGRDGTDPDSTLPDSGMDSGSDAGEPGGHLGPGDLAPDEERLLAALERDAQSLREPSIEESLAAGARRRGRGAAAGRGRRARRRADAAFTAPDRRTERLAGRSRGGSAGRHHCASARKVPVRPRASASGSPPPATRSRVTRRNACHMAPVSRAVRGEGAQPRRRRARAAPARWRSMNVPPSVEPSSTYSRPRASSVSVTGGQLRRGVGRGRAEGVAGRRRTGRRGGGRTT